MVYDDYYSGFNVPPKQPLSLGKLNALIAKEERSINDFYRQIGQIYCSLYASSNAPEFSALIRAINESMQRIKQYNIEICAIKNLVICNKCGVSNADTAAFCSSCGNALSQVKPPYARTVQCSVCKSEMPNNLAFCTVCGNVISTSAPTTNMPTKRCTACNTLLEDNILFCTECGKRIE